MSECGGRGNRLTRRWLENNPPMTEVAKKYMQGKKYLRSRLQAVIIVFMLEVFFLYRIAHSLKNCIDVITTEYRHVEQNTSLSLLGLFNDFHEQTDCILK